VEEHLDLAVLPVEAVLLVADVADGTAGEVLDLVADDIGPAHLAGNHDPIGRGQRLAGDARFRHGRDVGIDDGVRDAITHLVGMTLGNRLAGEEVVAARH
jgi:hypothetical protein